MIELTPNRQRRFLEVASKRQTDLTVILENVHDPHNIGAVLRSCDSVGIDEIYVLYTDERLITRGIEDNHGSSTGINRWINVQYYTELSNCMKAVRSKYQKVVGTNLNEEARVVYDMDFTNSVAIAFGNEKDGLSAEITSHLDGNFKIPQVGFAQSLNISVACAVTLYEIYRQRSLKGKYDDQENSDILNRYIGLNEEKRLTKTSKRISL